jgi:hypothetical protein
MAEQYTVEQHAALIGLTGKCLDEFLGDYGKDVFINCITKYARQRGNRMRNRAIRDGRELNYETFLAYGELSFETLPGDYRVKSESPVYINCCMRCRWDLGWKMYGLSEYGKAYCRYVDINLVQGFQPDMVMIAETMIGLGDECCTFVNVGYEQTPESKERIAAMKRELNGRYVRDFAYHMGHWLHAAEEVTGGILNAEDFAAFDRKLKQDFAGLVGEEMADLVWQESEQDFDAI